MGLSFTPTTSSIHVQLAACVSKWSYSLRAISIESSTTIFLISSTIVEINGLQDHNRSHREKWGGGHVGALNLLSLYISWLYRKNISIFRYLLFLTVNQSENTGFWIGFNRRLRIGKIISLRSKYVLGEIETILLLGSVLDLSSNIEQKLWISQKKKNQQQSSMQSIRLCALKVLHTNTVVSTQTLSYFH